MFNDYLELYNSQMKNLNRSEHTIRQYQRELNNFFLFLEEKNVKNLSDVQTFHIDLYHSVLTQKGNSSASRAKKISVLKSFFKFLSSRKYLSNNPTEALDPVKIKDVDKKKQETLTIDESLKLIDKMVKHSIPSLRLRNKLILLTFILCGLRVSELCDLKIEDVDLKNKTLHVKGKGGKIREVPLFDEMVQDLKRYLKERNTGSDFLFTKKNTSKQLVTGTVYALIKDHVKKAKIKKNIGCHSLRRTAASHLLLSGVNMRFIQQYLGHSNITTTMLYLQVDKEEIKDTIRSSNMLSKQLKKKKKKE